MRYIMRRSCLFLVMIAVIVFTGCGQKKKEDPVTVTLWHVSEETLEWLEWYNSIPPEKQLAVNSIPAELYTDDGVGTVDADQEK